MQQEGHSYTLLPTDLIEKTLGETTVGKMEN